MVLCHLYVYEKDVTVLDHNVFNQDVTVLYYLNGYNQDVTVLDHLNIHEKVVEVLDHLNVYVTRSGKISSNKSHIWISEIIIKPESAQHYL